MLLRKEVTQASDVELLAVILGKRRAAETLLQKAGGSLFTLFFAMPHEGGDMSSRKVQGATPPDPAVKLQAARKSSSDGYHAVLGVGACRHTKTS